MFNRHLKTVFRHILSHESNAIVNIVGLIVGFAAFLLIFLVIQYEKSFDNFHKDVKDIYRIVREGRHDQKGNYSSSIPFPVSKALRDEFSQLKEVAGVFGDNNVQVNIPATDNSALRKFKEPDILVAEPQFFKIFSFSLAEGDINSALNEPNTTLLTKKIAEKYFGDWRKAMGKIVNLYGHDIKVTGILNNPPSNTDFPLGIVVSYATLKADIDMNDWSSISNNYCFVQLKEDYSVKKFEKLLQVFVDEHIKPINPSYTLTLQPLSEMHYDPQSGNFTGRTFSRDLLVALRLIAIFLLIIACVNFINLTTANAINRAREVGVRKVLGGSRAQLLLQFWGETAVTALIALIGALMGVFICLPFVSTLLDIQVSPSILLSMRFMLSAFAALVLVIFLSGFYPALMLSNFKVAIVLKGNTMRHGKTGISFRRGLVVFQFVVAQVLIIGALVVAAQMNYFRTADMGFSEDAVITASFPRDSMSSTKMDLWKNDLSKVPGIKNVSLSFFAPAFIHGGWYTDLRLPGNKSNKPDEIVNMKIADTSFFSLYGLQLVAGRIYFPADTMREFVVNETAVRKLGIQDPQKAIGKLINVAGRTLPIVGVVKDYHTNSLRDPIEPIVMTTKRNVYGIANIKINLKQTKSVIVAMQKLWNENFPDYYFDYHFIDQSIAAFYEQENRLSKFYKIFAGIAIFISCLGLYGLIAFMAVQRKKEIGIRKVLGAPVSNIMIMLSREFTLLIAIAFFIASPIASYFMHQWLQQYAYHIMMGLWFYIATILGSLCIAWFTVGYTAIKAATANPVKSLRTE